MPNRGRREGKERTEEEAQIDTKREVAVEGMECFPCEGTDRETGFVRLAARRVGQATVKAVILLHIEVFDTSWIFTDSYLRGRSSCFHPALLLQCSLQHTATAPRVEDKRFSLSSRDA